MTLDDLNGILEDACYLFCGYGFNDFGEAVKEAIENWQEDNDYPETPTFEQIADAIEEPALEICRHLSSEFLRVLPDNKLTAIPESIKEITDEDSEDDGGVGFPLVR